HGARRSRGRTRPLDGRARRRGSTARRLRPARALGVDAATRRRAPLRRTPDRLAGGGARHGRDGDGGGRRRRTRTPRRPPVGDLPSRRAAHLPQRHRRRRRVRHGGPRAERSGRVSGRFVSLVVVVAGLTGYHLAQRSMPEDVRPVPLFAFVYGAAALVMVAALTVDGTGGMR